MCCVVLPILFLILCCCSVSHVVASVRRRGDADGTHAHVNEVPEPAVQGRGGGRQSAMCSKWWAITPPPGGGYEAAQRVVSKVLGALGFRTWR